MSRDQTGKQGNNEDSEPTLKSGEETQSALKHFSSLYSFLHFILCLKWKQGTVYK